MMVVIGMNNIRNVSRFIAGDIADIVQHMVFIHFATPYRVYVIAHWGPGFLRLSSLVLKVRNRHSSQSLPCTRLQIESLLFTEYSSGIGQGMQLNQRYAHP